MYKHIVAGNQNMCRYNISDIMWREFAHFSDDFNGTRERKKKELLINAKCERGNNKNEMQTIA